MSNTRSNSSKTKLDGVQQRLEAAEEIVKKQAAQLVRMEAVMAKFIQLREEDALTANKKRGHVEEEKEAENSDAEDLADSLNRKKAKVQYGDISASGFLAEARAYLTHLNTLDATCLSMIASHILEKGRERALINLLCLTGDFSNVDRNDVIGI